MNKHTRTTLRILILAIIVAFVILTFVTLALSNNNAAEYRSQLSNQIAQVYPDFNEQKENFYDLTGIDEIVETEEAKRNQLFNEFYNSLDVPDKAKVDSYLDESIDNINSSIDYINSKLAELTDMFETATAEELQTFQNDFHLKSEELTSRLDSFYDNLSSNN